MFFNFLIFSSDDTTHLSTSQNEVKEVVVITEWLAQYAHVDSVYDCIEITNHPTNPHRPRFNFKISILCFNYDFVQK